MTRSNLAARIDRLPPFVARFLARPVGCAARELTLVELRNSLGWHISKVRMASKLDSWAPLRVRDADAFAGLCGVKLHDLSWNLNEWQEQMRKPVPLPHLKRSRFKQLVTMISELKDRNPKHPLFG